MHLAVVPGKRPGVDRPFIQDEKRTMRVIAGGALLATGVAPPVAAAGRRTEAREPDLLTTSMMPALLE